MGLNSEFLSGRTDLYTFHHFDVLTEADDGVFEVVKPANEIDAISHKDLLAVVNNQIMWLDRRYLQFPSPLEKVFRHIAP